MEYPGLSSGQGQLPNPQSPADAITVGPRDGGVGGVAAANGVLDGMPDDFCGFYGFVMRLIH